MNAVREGQALSPREAEVLALVMEGCRWREIAERLCIERRTVEGHLAAARVKLDARTTAQAVARYLTGKRRKEYAASIQY